MEEHKQNKITGQNIGYIRVSTIEQNAERQLDGIALDKIFTDKCSGKDTNRPQLRLMLEFIREGDTVYVHSMDRLARNLDDLRGVVNKLASKGVAVKFVKEGLTFNGQEAPMATLMLSVMGAFAEFERSLIRERQKEGIALAKKAGKYRGRSKCFTDEQINEIQQMVKERYKKVDIAKKFGVSRNTLHRYIKGSPAPIEQSLHTITTSELKKIKILLRLVVENNSQWVRGKKKTYEDIEMFTLPYYDFEKTKNEHEYILTIEYENEVDLDRQIEDLHSEIWSHADSRNCFIDDTSISTLDKEKYWY
jgi:DNA invertase Pin-like site-specific DNA recombinase